MLIGELAARGGVTTKTLRFYEEIGVLPEPVRTPAGYRQYGEDSLDRLAFIHAAQTAGLSLAEVRTIITIRDGGGAPCSHVVELLDAKAAALTRQVAELRKLERELDQIRERAISLDPAACDPRRVCEVLLPAPR